MQKKKIFKNWGNFAIFENNTLMCATIASMKGLKHALKYIWVLDKGFFSYCSNLLKISHHNYCNIS